MSPRTLAWDGCLNVRDLGGHATEDGGETAHGAVVRADSVRKLSDRGWEAVVGHGVRTVVDLRFHEELAADPPRELPVDVVHVPLMSEPGDPIWQRIEELAAAQPDAAGATREIYLAMLDERAPRFAEAVSAVAEAPAGGVVVHCAVGKDRTGLVAALLLRLAGVSVQDVAADYALSEANLAPISLPWVAEAPDDIELERRRRMIATPAAAMTGVLERLEAQHGSVGGYLQAGGASARVLERAQARLRG